MKQPANTTGQTDGDKEGSNNSEGRTDGTDGDAGGGGFRRGVVSSLLGVAGLWSLIGGGKATTNSHEKRLIVVGDGPGEHSYEIELGWNESIELAAQAGGNDTITSNNSEATGTLYHWNVDTYRFSGSLNQIKANGAVSIHFPDGAYQSVDRVDVTGQERGTHGYEIASNSADMELGRNTGSADKDPSGGDDSERTADRVTGRLKNTGYDTITIGDNPVQNLRVTEGHVKFS